MKTTLLNLALYQTGWFILVLGAAAGYPWRASALALVLVAVHLALVWDRRAEMLTILAIGLLGTAVDSVQAAFGVFVFEAGYYSAWLVPFWLTVMWLQFATLFHFALRWLSRRYFLAGLAGAVGGPLAFLTGERLDGVIFPFGHARSLLVLAGVWALLLPACVLAADRFRPRGLRTAYRLFA